MHVIARFQMMPFENLFNTKIDGNEENKIAFVDNVISEMISGNTKLVDLMPYDYEIDHHDDDTDDELPIRSLFLDVIFHLDDEFVNDYKNHEKQITETVAGLLQDKDVYWQYQWLKGHEEHIAFTIDND